MRSDPLPCPFCGETRVRAYCTGGWWCIRCTQRKCQAHAYPFAETEAEAVAAWNRRPAPPVPATPLDVEAPGPPKLESRADLHRTATRLEKEGLAAGSGTVLDAEACARLLDDLILMLAPHDARSIADANQLRALKAALPGMGKDSDAIDALERGEIELECMGTETRYFNVYVPNAPLLTTAGGAPLRAVLAEALAAARAAQPEETSADA